MQVQLIAATEFRPPSDVPWETDATGGQALAEFAGRACYQSWDKPVPATATNAGYLDHILHVGHLSVLEHSSATFYVTGISRAVSHELLRHRHLSISELSQRFSEHAPDVMPAAVAAEPELRDRFEQASASSRAAHRDLLAALESSLTDVPNGRLARKQARQAARSVLVQSTPTKVVVTGNYRAWRHFIGARGSDPADTEIRALAVAILRGLQALAPNVFADFRISALADGTETAASPLVGEG